MLPGPTIFRRCPSCSSSLREYTLASGNTFGARFWTDGKYDAPMLEHLSSLVKCPRCEHPVWLDDAEEIGRVDHLLIGLLRTKPRRYKLRYLADARPWWKRLLGIGEPEMVPDLCMVPVRTTRKVREEIKREAALKEQLMAVSKELYRTSLEPQQPEEEDYLNFAASEGLEPVKERHARTMAWWCANDATRDQTGDYSDFALSETQRQNLFRLSELLDPETDDDRVTKAEIARGLGNFDVGLDLLSEPVRDDLANTAETVASLCRQRKSAVAEIPGEPW